MSDEFREIQIDPVHPLLSRVVRFFVNLLLSCAFLMAVAAVVWFFVFSPLGPRWIDEVGGVDRTRSDMRSASFPKLEVKMSDPALTLTVGDTAWIRTTLQTSAPISLSNLTVRWQSECPEVAQVDDYGHVIAKSAGTAYVRASVTDREVDAHSGVCIVTVRMPHKSRPAAVPDIIDGKSAFAGKAVFDSVRSMVIFNSRAKIVLHSHRGHSITMRPGDVITDAVLAKNRYLISGRFVKGSNSKVINGLWLDVFPDDGFE